MFVVRRRALKDVVGAIESSVGVTGEAGWREKGGTIILLLLIVRVEGGGGLACCLGLLDLEGGGA